jgi:Cu/Ag efflux pump CusA
VGIGPVLDAVNHRLKTVTLPLGYHAEAFSDMQVGRSADTRTLWFVLAALIAVYLLLQAAFHSWGRALVVLVTLPLALAGGALTGLIAGTAVTAGTLLGFLTVFGLALRQGIMLVRRIQRLERDGGATDAETAYLEPRSAGIPDPAAVLRATRETAFPLIVSAVGVALAVIPFMIRGTVPGVEFVRPLALVVLGGLVTTAFTTLFVLPALYRRFIVRQADPTGDSPATPAAPAPAPIA